MKDRKFPLGFIRVTLISLVIMIVVLLMAVNPDFKAVLKKWGSTSETHWILEENQTYLLCGHTLIKQRQFSSERLFKRAMGARLRLPAFQDGTAVWQADPQTSRSMPQLSPTSVPGNSRRPNSSIAWDTYPAWPGSGEYRY